MCAVPATLLVAIAVLAAPGTADARPTPSPTATRSATPSPTPSPSPPSSGGGGVEAEPSAAEIAAQLRAAQLHAEVQRQGAAVLTEQQKLDAATADANSALEAYRQSAQQAAVAQVRAIAEQADLDDANAALDERRVQLGRWARQAYAEGGMLATSPALTTFLTGGSTDDVVRALYWIGKVGDTQARLVVDLKVALAHQQELAASAEAAARSAATAAADAAAAKTERDAAVSEQRALLTAMQVQLRATSDAAAAADAQAQGLASARLWASGGAGPIGAGGNVVTGAVGDCPGGDTRAYGNGQIPLSALCPVWGAPGQYLRADAAFAFGKLSAAYARRFGTPICVTDSYRSYAEQIAVYASRPDLAAVPGTSNHGWGTAADLCGGIESFSTLTHAWMLVNAPSYGWFHPGWAEPNGSRPEPWHWEYGG